MGFRDSMRKMLGRKTASEVIASRNAAGFEEVRRLISQGASREELSTVFESLINPNEFNSIVGDIALTAPPALQLTILDLNGEAVNQENKAILWEQFTQAQTRCQKFFEGTSGSSVLYWAIAKSLKSKWKSADWNFVDTVIYGAAEDYWRTYRIDQWIYTAWSYKILEEVEIVSGPASCTSERFKSAWSKYSSADIRAYAYSLCEDEKRHYQCRD